MCGWEQLGKNSSRHLIGFLDGISASALESCPVLPTIVTSNHLMTSASACSSSSIFYVFVVVAVIVVVVFTLKTVLTSIREYLHVDTSCQGSMG